MSVPGEYMSIELTLNSQHVGASFVEGVHHHSAASGTAVLSLRRTTLCLQEPIRPTFLVVLSAVIT